MGRVKCSFCRKEYYKDNKHINENRKLGHNFFCSPSCQYTFKNKQKEFTCENKGCKNRLKRAPHSISLHNYCSRSCAVTVNNTRFSKRVAVIRKCAYCYARLFKYGRIFCSFKCRGKAQAIKEEEIIDQIRMFYKSQGRIPLKREFKHYSAARMRFGTWNKAIEAAGFKPNPVMFSDNCVANDGHTCNSIAEKIIDDYLYEKGIVHERNVLYPKGIYTADFRIGNKLIEYFGLAGEHKRYDELRKIKKKMAKKYKLDLVEVYPKDLYPHSKLDKFLQT